MIYWTLRNPRMRPARAMLIALSCVVLAVDACPAAGPLVTRRAAARAGLERAWFTQLGVDPARSEVSRWYLHFGRLYGVTTSGAAFSVDANSGQRMWIRQISPPGRAAFGPSANQRYVAVVSGSKLYLLDLHDGRTRWIHDLGSAPGAGPALSKTHAYVAMVNGRIEGYKLDSPDARPWYYQSKGRAYSQPTTTGKVVSWPTDQGFLYVSRAEDPLVLYRLETGNEIVASPAEREPYLYVASLDGYLYCIHEITGREAWRFSTGYFIKDAPAVVGNRAYVGSFEPALHAIDAETGRQLWSASGLTQFVAQGKGKVYAADRFGNLTVLDAETGASLGALKVAEGVRPLVNDKTDRIYLVNRHGLIQCLHEIGVDEPVEYRKPVEPSAADNEEAQDGQESPFEGEREATPFEAEDQPAEPPDEPDEQPDEGNIFDAFEGFEIE